MPGASPEADLAAVITRIMRGSGYDTQRKLAKALQVSQGTVSNYLHPQSGRKPGLAMIRRIAEVCGTSERQCTEYEQAMLQARVLYEFPGVKVAEGSASALPPLEMPSAFRQRVEADLAKIPLRRRRSRLEAVGLTGRQIRRVLRGEALLTVEEVRALAHALGGNEEIYLALVNKASERFLDVVSQQSELLTALLNMSAASKKDLGRVLRFLGKKGGGPRSKPRTKAP